MCSGVSPLWFLFITAGLPGDSRRPVAAMLDGDLRRAEPPGDGLSAAFLVRLPLLLWLAGLREAAGWRMTGDIWDFLLLLGEALGLFGVVSSVATFASAWARSGLRCEWQLCGDGFNGRGSVWFRSLKTPLTWGGFSATALLLVPTFSELTPGSSECSSANAAGLWKETFLLDLLDFSTSASSLSFRDSGSSMIAHCWLIASSLFFLTVSTFCFLAAPIAAEFFLLAAVCFVTFFFLLPFLEIWEQDELESWEDEAKLNTDRSPRWAEAPSDCVEFPPSEVLHSGTATSDGFSTTQRTLRLRGLNQILKFFLNLTGEFPGGVRFLTGEWSAKKESSGYPKEISAL